jgi:hypothetical protein
MAGTASKSPTFGSPEWRAKYGMGPKKTPAPTTSTTTKVPAPTTKAPAFGTPAWRAKYGK